jgi:DNA mismatch repair protein MutL
MVVDDLFFNTPARLKFLKSPKTELGQIEEMVQGLALSHPSVQFTLSINDKTTIQTDGANHLKNTCMQVFGWQATTANALLETTFEDTVSNLTLKAVFATPAQEAFHKRTKKAWWMLLNGRTVRCAILAKAIQKAFEGLVPHGVFPFCAIWVEMPVTEVDVNVHPTKKEVRYADSEQIFKFVYAGIRRALQEQFHASYGFQQSAGFHQAIGTQPAVVPTASEQQPTANPIFWRPTPTEGNPTAIGFTPQATSNSQSVGGSSTQTALDFYQPLPESSTPLPTFCWKPRKG